MRGSPGTRSRFYAGGVWGFPYLCTMVYDLPLAEEKVKPHQVTTLHLVCALGFIGTGAIIAIYNFIIPLWGSALLAGGVLLLALTLFKNKWVTSKNTNPLVRIAELTIAITIAIYSAIQHWKLPTGMFAVLSAGLVFALYWERKAGGTLYVHVDDTGLRLPVVRRRFLRWTEVDEVVYRFGTLTINTADNHLFQWNIADPDFDNEIFEAFCLAKIEDNRAKRRNNDW